jgi:hypothetical protein
MRPIPLSRGRGFEWRPLALHTGFATTLTFSSLGVLNSDGPFPHGHATSYSQSFFSSPWFYLSPQNEEALFFFLFFRDSPLSRVISIGQACGRTLFYSSQHSGTRAVCLWILDAVKKLWAVVCVHCTMYIGRDWRSRGLSKYHSI